MKVPRPSVSATGVSIALYYLAYCEDAMERICLMSQTLVSEVVKYALWLLSSAHDSGRCHATMFFGLSFQFKIILDEFDNQDGLRKLYNVVSDVSTHLDCRQRKLYIFSVHLFLKSQISVLPILSTEEHTLNDDEECAARQMIRHVSVALKKYMESHLFYKYTQMSRLNEPVNSAQTINLYRVSGALISTEMMGFIIFVLFFTIFFQAPKLLPETISEQATALQEMLPVRARWEPVDKILALNGIPLLLRIIASSYEWIYSGRWALKFSIFSSIGRMIVYVCDIAHISRDRLISNRFLFAIIARRFLVRTV